MVTQVPEVARRDGDWILLSYRLPREPSTPRIAVWRKLRRLGVLQLGDGLVALPADPSTVEHLEWVAEQVVEANGTAMVWTARPTARREHDRLVSELIAARNLEYEELRAEIEAGSRFGDEPVTRRTISRWRRRFRRIQRRDHYGAPAADDVFGLLNTAASEVFTEAGERR